MTPLCRGSLKSHPLNADMLGVIEREGCSVNYIFIANESAPRNEAEATSVVADGNGLDFIAPRAWVANPRLCESSFDLHHGLDVNEDTVPAELLNDLFKL